MRTPSLADRILKSCFSGSVIKSKGRIKGIKTQAIPSKILGNTF